MRPEAAVLHQKSTDTGNRDRRSCLPAGEHPGDQEGKEDEQARRKKCPGLGSES
jgi:hypothetical protein